LRERSALFCVRARSDSAAFDDHPHPFALPAAHARRGETFSKGCGGILAEAPAFGGFSGFPRSMRVFPSCDFYCRFPVEEVTFFPISARRSFFSLSLRNVRAARSLRSAGCPVFLYCSSRAAENTRLWYRFFFLALTLAETPRSCVTTLFLPARGRYSLFLLESNLPRRRS